MIRWIIILFTAGQCLAGSTNWLAQRPGLVSDYGNLFANDKVPLSLTGNLIGWWPFPANFGATQYCFGTACTNDLTVSGATWANNYGGGMEFTNSTAKIYRPMTPALNATNQASWIISMRLNSFGGGGFGRVISCYTPGGVSNNGYMIFVETNASPVYNCIRFLSSNADSSIRSSNSLYANSNVIVGVTYSSGNVAFYFNGIRSGGGTVNQYSTTTNAYYIGNNVYDNLRYFDGTIFEIMQFNRALLSNEHFSIFETIKPHYGL